MDRIKEGVGTSEKPWVLFVSLVRPHFPLTAPPEFFALYPPERMPMPRLYDEAGRPRHPAVSAIRSVMNYDDFFADERRSGAPSLPTMPLSASSTITSARSLAALEAAGLTASTRVIYTSDHGDNLGSRGLWGKSVMYEESVAVPLVMAGAGIPSGLAVDTPVSLVDCYRTVLEAVGCPVSEDDQALPSRSLWDASIGPLPTARCCPNIMPLRRLQAPS